MRESGNILTSPARMVMELWPARPTRITLPPATWTLICGSDPKRQALYYQGLTNPFDVFVSLVPLGSIPVVATLQSNVIQVIHSAAYLTLTGEAWYAYSTAGQDVLVWDATRQYEGR